MVRFCDIIMSALWNNIITFNLHKVISYSALEVLKNIASNKYKGQSFLANYNGLLYGYYKYNNQDVLNYIVLAAQRDLKHCRSYDILTLDADFCKLSISEINKNKLIWYNNGSIYFKFEEERASTLSKRNIKNGN